MKLVFEGETWQEALREVREFMARIEGGGTPAESATMTLASIAPGALTPEVLDFIRSKAGSHATRRQLVEMYLIRVAELGTDIEIGTSSRTKDKLNHYLMVRDSGPRRFGAVSYVRPSTGGVTLRLPESAAAGRTQAKTRDLTNKEKAYQVRVQLTSESAVTEAVELTKLALEEVRQNS